MVKILMSWILNMILKVDLKIGSWQYLIFMPLTLFLNVNVEGENEFKLFGFQLMKVL